MKSCIKGKGNGKRLSGNRVKVRVTKNEQYAITIPKTIALFLGLNKGKIIKYEFDNKSRKIYLNVEKGAPVASSKFKQPTPQHLGVPSIKQYVEREVSPKFKIQPQNKCLEASPTNKQDINELFKQGGT